MPRGYSGFNVSHYKLPFPTRDCVPYVRFGLYQLFIHVKEIHVCALHCVRVVTSFRIAFEVLSIGMDTTLSVSRVVYRQRTDHVGCFCCRAIVQLFLLLLIISLL